MYVCVFMCVLERVICVNVLVHVCILFIHACVYVCVYMLVCERKSYSRSLAKSQCICLYTISLLALSIEPRSSCSLFPLSQLCRAT